MKLVWLDITTYLGSIGAEHWYGELLCPSVRVGPDKWNSYRKSVERVLDETEAAYLSKKDGWTIYAGEMTSRFNKKIDIVPVAIELFNKEFDPTTDFLCKGTQHHGLTISDVEDYMFLAGNEENFKLFVAMPRIQREKYVYSDR